MFQKEEQIPNHKECRKKMLLLTFPIYAESSEKGIIKKIKTLAIPKPTCKIPKCHRV